MDLDLEIEQKTKLQGELASNSGLPDVRNKSVTNFWIPGICYKAISGKPKAPNRTR